MKKTKSIENLARKTSDGHLDEACSASSRPARWGGGVPPQRAAAGAQVPPPGPGSEPLPMPCLPPRPSPGRGVREARPRFGPDPANETVHAALRMLGSPWLSPQPTFNVFSPGPVSVTHVVGVQYVSNRKEGVREEGGKETSREEACRELVRSNQKVYTPNVNIGRIFYINDA